MTDTEAYNSADPFPHVVVDNFLTEQVCGLFIDHFPSLESHDWFTYQNSFENKLASNRMDSLPIEIVSALTQLNGYHMIHYLERLTGIQNLIPDPKCRGGGLHLILPGGKLDIHADFNLHPDLNLDRRLNVLIYLNKDWKEEYGGYLELWNSDMTECRKKIAPIYNRMVCFSTTDKAYHGHPDPVRCPPGMARRSIALYYYTCGRPESEKSAPHSTLFQRRPGDQTSDEIEALRAKRGQSRLSTESTKSQEIK